MRSSAASPMPTSFTGTPSSCSIASTTPPLAVPSSLVSTTPVMSTASVNCARLGQTVLAGRRVEHEQHLVERAGRAFDDTAQLLQLLHEVDLRVEATGGVDEYEIGAAPARGVHRVEDDRAGVGALLAADEVDADALGPRPELLGRRGPERVGGGRAATR